MIRRLGGIPLYDREAARAIDRETMETFGLPGPVLMEQAGRAVAESILERVPDGEVLVLAGGGNNGGDGYVVARWLAEAGRAVTVAAVTPPERLRGDAAWAHELWRRVEGTTEVVEPSELPVLVAARLPHLAVLVDALYGTGLSAPLRPEAAAMLAALAELVQRAGLPVVAVDVPSGLDVDTGASLGAVLPATWTVTMGFEKLGLRLWPGAGYAGEVVVAPLGYPRRVLERYPPRAELVADPAPLLPERPRDGHKGTFGTVAVAASSATMPGAGALVARGALRMGAGRVWHVSERGGHAVDDPEVIRLGGDGSWEELAPALPSLVDAAEVLVVGPGLGRTSWLPEALTAWCATWRRSLVLDADALWALAQLGGTTLPRGTILTPHPGEAGLLLGVSAGEVQADRYGAARELVARYGAVVLLKGAGPIVAAADGTWILPIADPRLAVPGSGDVLAGAIGALLAAGCEPVVATVAAVLLHGRAVAELPPVGNLARELADRLPWVWPR